MDQCKRILKLPGEYSIWSHLGSSRNPMNRQAGADVAAAVTPPASHPKPNTRWRRYNPMSKLRWRKSKATAIPHVHGQKVKSVRSAATMPAAKLNYVNPLYYIRRVKNNLTNSNRHGAPFERRLDSPLKSLVSSLDCASSLSRGNCFAKWLRFWHALNYPCGFHQ